MGLRALLLLVPAASVACVLVVACGTDAPTDPASSATDAGGSGDSGAAVAVSGVCPGSVPAEGAACPKLLLQCEYGDFDFADCNATATCTRLGWSVAPPPIASCVNNALACPSSASSIVPGDACASTSTCLYRDATCACTTKGSPDGGALWACVDRPDGCSTVRPLLGAPCATEGQLCDYGGCGLFHNIAQRCEDGVWHFVFSTCDGG